MPRRSLRQLYLDEFRDYSLRTFREDLLAAATVAAVALPLALAFGVASGATAAAGLVTAIIAGVVIGALSGAPYQISGPTGAMSAVLIVLAHRYGLQSVLLAGCLSGVLLLGIGVLRLGRFIAFIPAPVITGFTSGIAVIIAVGQLDYLFGVKTPTYDSAAGNLLHYLTHPLSPNWYALAVGGAVIAIAGWWPREWNLKIPGALVGIIVATLVATLLDLPVETVQSIPTSLVLPDRLTLPSLNLLNLPDLAAPVLTITALGAVESLLCGSVGARMTGTRLQANQELIAQGLGNIAIPFFGGVPATAAIARTSVAIKAGGRTRLVSILHALILLASMFVLAPVMSKIPKTALAGVLIVTAWRMSEWESIHYYFTHRLRTAIATFLITMVATFTLDLTQAILVGSFLSGAIFLSQIAELHVDLREVDASRLELDEKLRALPSDHIRVAYLSGPLFFAATGHFTEAFSRLPVGTVLILSIRGVPLIDTSGLQALLALHDKLHSQGGRLMITGAPPGVARMLERGGVTEAIGSDNIFWSAETAIAAALTSRMGSSSDQ